MGLGRGGVLPRRPRAKAEHLVVTFHCSSHVLRGLRYSFFTSSAWLAGTGVILVLSCASGPSQGSQASDRLAHMQDHHTRFHARESPTAPVFHATLLMHDARRQVPELVRLDIVMMAYLLMACCPCMPTRWKLNTLGSHSYPDERPASCTSTAMLQATLERPVRQQRGR